MRKIVNLSVNFFVWIALLQIILGPASAWAEMSFTYSGCPCTGGTWPSVTWSFTNNTNVNLTLKGFRFKTPNNIGWSCFGGPAATKSGAGPTQWEQLLASYDQVRPVGSSLNTYSCGGSVPAGQDGTPYDLQTLIKTGGCDQATPIPTPTPIACASLGALTSTAGYYSSTCIPHPTGSLGGNHSGGFVDSFAGQTQIQIGIPTNTFTVNGTPVKWSPLAMGGNGTMYMMATAMGQEYFNISMLQLFGHGAKEGFAALYNSAGTATNAGDQLFIENNAAGVNGTYHIEMWTLGRVIQTYANFFPRHVCASAYPDVTTGSSAACVAADGSYGGGPANWGGVGNWYMCSQTSGCPYIAGTSPQLVNSVIASGLNLWWVYDALSLSNKLCWYQFLECSSDPHAAMGFLAAAYNLGINSGFESSLQSQNAAMCASTNLVGGGYTPTGNSNYVPEVMTTITNIEASQDCDGSTIYDSDITLANLQAFFFGTGGTASTPAVGGLWAHYPELYNSSATRNAMWTQVQCAFTALSAHWGGSVIKYRYDFLTILRVAKQYFNTVKAYPSNDEFNTWVNGHSQASSPCGMSSDAVFPTLAISSPNANTVTAQCPGFSVNFSGSDNVAVQSAEWTMDPNWGSWHGLGATSPWTFVVPGSEPNYPAANAQGKLWVRVTDTCGNSTVQQINFLNQCGTPTSTPTRSFTASPTRSFTPSASPSPTFSASYTRSFTASVTPSSTYSASPTRSFTPSASSTLSPSHTATLSATPTPSLSSSPSRTATPSATLASTPTYSATFSASPTLSFTRSPSPTLLPTGSPTQSPTQSPSATASPSGTQTATLSPSRSPSHSPTQTATATASPSASSSASPSFTRTPSATLLPTGSVTQSSTQSPSATVTATFLPTGSATQSATPSSTGTLTATLLPTGSATDSPTLSASPTQSATASSSASATSSATATGTRTASPTLLPTGSATQTATFSATRSATPTYSVTASPSATRSATTSVTLTSTPTESPTHSVSPTFTVTPENYLEQDRLIKFKGFYPNPFVDQVKMFFTLRVPATIGVIVYNVAGEIVHQQSQYFDKAGKSTMLWLGENNQGARSASGVYLIHIKGEGNDGSRDHFWGHVVISR